MDLTLLQNDPAEFRNRLFIDTDGGIYPFSEIADDWQMRDFAALDAGWQRAIGQPVDMPQDAQFSRAWLERPRGHSKTLDLSVAAAWALFAARRRLSGIGAAGDLDQARLLRDALGRLLHVNPWLASILELQVNRIVNRRTESTLQIITSDAPTSYGLTPDFIIADEVVHWSSRALWDSLLSSAAKRKSCLMVSITNAGIENSWQQVLREKIRNDPRWYFSRLDGPVASWIDDDVSPGVAARRRRTPLVIGSLAGSSLLEQRIRMYGFGCRLHPITRFLMINAVLQNWRDMRFALIFIRFAGVFGNSRLSPLRIKSPLLYQLSYAFCWGNFSN